MQGAGNKKEAAAMLTVEAAYVFGILFFCMAVLISFGFRTHDAVVGNAVLNEGMELLGHSAEPSAEEISARGTARMAQSLYRKGFLIQIEGDREQTFGTAVGGEYQRQMEDRGFRPETFLRQITLLEAVTG